MARRAVVLALLSAACGGRVDAETVTVELPPRGAAPPRDASCALSDPELGSFAVDDAAIWRLQIDCRPNTYGSVILREDRRTGDRRVVADGVRGAPPVALAGDAMLVRGRDAIHRVRLDGSGAVDEVSLKTKTMISDGSVSFVVVDGGAAESRYSVLSVGASGDAVPFGSIPATFQLQSIVARDGRVFANLWSVCSSASSSCAGVYGVDAGGVRPIASWPVADVGAKLGPLAVAKSRAVTTVGAEVVEAAAGAVRTIARFDDADVVVSLALGERGTYACAVRSGDPLTGRVIAIGPDGAARELANSGCEQLVWSSGELFWLERTRRDHYGHAVIARTLGRAAAE